MQNVTVCDSTGEEVAFFKYFPTTRKDQEKMIADKIGTGKFKIKWHQKKKFTDKMNRKQTGLPRQQVLWVGELPNSPMIIMETERQRAGIRSGAPRADELILEKLAALEKKIEAYEADEEDDDEEDDRQEDGPSLRGQIGLLIGKEKYQKLFSGLLTGDPDKIMQTFDEVKQNDPEALRGLILELVQIFLFQE